MKPIILTVKAPCAWIRLNGGHGNRYARADLIRTWRQAAAWEARRVKLPRITDYPVRIIATVHLDTNPSRWDPTNWLLTAKACVDGLVLHPKHGGWDVLADDDSRHVIGPDMRAGEQWADAALVLTIQSLNQEEAMTDTRHEAFIELLPPDVGHNLRHFAPETAHVTGQECHCQPERIPHAQPIRSVTGVAVPPRRGGVVG